MIDGKKWRTVKDCRLVLEFVTKEWKRQGNKINEEVYKLGSGDKASNQIMMDYIKSGKYGDNPIEILIFGYRVIIAEAEHDKYDNLIPMFLGNLVAVCSLLGFSVLDISKHMKTGEYFDKFIEENRLDIAETEGS